MTAFWSLCCIILGASFTWLVLDDRNDLGRLCDASSASFGSGARPAGKGDGFDDGNSISIDGVASVVIKTVQDARDTTASTSASDDQPKNGSTSAFSSSFDQTWPDLKRRMCPKMRPNRGAFQTLFSLARSELGFTQVPENHVPNEDQAGGCRLVPFQVSREDMVFAQQFFTTDKGVLGYTFPEGAGHVVYPRIWKAANNYIVGNLKHSMSQIEGGEIWEHKSTKQALQTHIPRSQFNTTCVITAVRDPVERFLSGYNEMEWRVAHWSNHRWETEKNSGRLGFVRHGNGTDARFRGFVSDLVRGAHSSGIASSSPHWSVHHFFSMAGVPWQFAGIDGLDVKYLPAISNLGVEFPEFLARSCGSGLPEGLGNEFSLKSRHPSQDDEHGFYSSAKRVWSMHDETARALCAVYAMDYACFDAIPVPSVCRDVFSSKVFRDAVYAAL
ncbi:hypothetical protein ACHAXT_005165 [Thalassiosira profunda]